jgi:hypothetical protein
MHSRFLWTFSQKHFQLFIAPVCQDFSDALDGEVAPLQTLYGHDLHKVTVALKGRGPFLPQGPVY